MLLLLSLCICILYHTSSHSFFTSKAGLKLQEILFLYENAALHVNDKQENMARQLALTLGHTMQGWMPPAHHKVFIEFFLRRFFLISFFPFFSSCMRIP